MGRRFACRNIPLASTSVITTWELKRYAGRYDDEMYRHLQTMHNEILARHGQKFAAGSEQAKYFGAQSWYKPQSDDVTSKITEIERINMATLNQILQENDRVTAMQTTEFTPSAPSDMTAIARALAAQIPAINGTVG